MTFYFYDLETSGINPRTARIMQFAGQRTDERLQPIGEPDNIFIRLSDDVLPEPDAIMVTGITPQHTRSEGISEAEFIQYFNEHIATAGTIMTGFNSVRFDDEFMRYINWRNFSDPYEWSWLEDRSRWDLLDVSRMMRALRPDGIEWPDTPDGVPTNKLELLANANNITHDSAHDALSDVQATVGLARLIRDKQPKLFNYLLGMRDKKRVEALVQNEQMFVYSSGRYPGEFQKTTIVSGLAKHPKKQATLVYDLRHDPAQFINMGVDELVEAWRWRSKDDPYKGLRLPVKSLQYNRCPAVAPISVVASDEAAQTRIALSTEIARQHYKTLVTAKDFSKNVVAAAKVIEQERTDSFASSIQPDEQLYDKFVPDADRSTMRMITAATAEEIAKINPSFKDDRLAGLWPLYKARNFPKSLTEDEVTHWEAYRADVLLSGQPSRIETYFGRLAELASQSSLTDQQKFVLEELQLWGQSIMPSKDEL